MKVPTPYQMASIRRARPDDLPAIQQCNLACLPENYPMHSYFFISLDCPQLSYVAEDYRGHVVGYVLGKIEEGNGHIVSVAVSRAYRKQGLATKLMLQVERAMKEVYSAEYVTLHVRETNRAAFTLYRDTLGFAVHKYEPGYYADGEGAYEMKKTLG
jgi:peptide alpha-N-acetyltransferase